MTPLAIPTLQHVAELGVFLLLAAVGTGLFAAFIIGLLGIWARVADEPDALDEEYRRVEAEGIQLATWQFDFLESGESPDAIRRKGPCLYNWATREPMVWMHHG